MMMDQVNRNRMPMQGQVEWISSKTHIRVSALVAQVRTRDDDSPEHIPSIIMGIARRTLLHLLPQVKRHFLPGKD